MYRELKVWQKSMDLVVKVYKLCDKLPKTEEYNLKSQIKRAIVSVPLNIAEGKCRYSSNDFAHFLNIANASLTEVEVGLEIAARLGFIEDYNSVKADIAELNKMLNALRTKIANNKKQALPLCLLASWHL